ncbi:hypothetical protein NE237_033203 [Protea cynaroides]|uniref:Uncharacterized protein n=1 Tax=Protea cynaroides TaxID=273540 RepID=A0A9Q0L5P4_9MAGN|nr:hypothetical protein NE237_033203 [Protea cynaroides]
MAASVPSCESWEFIDEEKVEMEGIQIPGIDSTLLMSLLEESQVEDAEDERLQCIIQSLEAEIDPCNMRETCKLDVQAGNSEVRAPQEFGLEDPYDVSALHSLPTHEFDLPPDDMEKNFSMPSDELGGMMELYGVSLEEQAYGCVWQETYDSRVGN